MCSQQNCFAHGYRFAMNLNVKYCNVCGHKLIEIAPASGNVINLADKKTLENTLSPIDESHNTIQTVQIKPEQNKNRSNAGEKKISLNDYTPEIRNNIFARELLKRLCSVYPDRKFHLSIGGIYQSRGFFKDLFANELANVYITETVVIYDSSYANNLERLINEINSRLGGNYKPVRKFKK